MSSRRIFLGASVLLIAFGICGAQVECDGTCLQGVTSKIIEDEDPTILDKIKAKMSAANIDANLRYSLNNFYSTIVFQNITLKPTCRISSISEQNGVLIASTITLQFNFSAHTPSCQSMVD